MKGTRPLRQLPRSDSFQRVLMARIEVRNRGLFMLGVSTGGRISELLSLQIGDVWQNGSAVTDLLFDRSIVKGGEVSRAVPVNRDGRRAIEELVGWHNEQIRETLMSRVPCSHRETDKAKRRMSRGTAHDVLKDAFEAAGLNGHLATHSMRKSFAQRLYDRTGDIFAVQEMLGHRKPYQPPRSIWM